MAELTQQERLQPSLLDRLMDDEPDITQESRSQRVLSIKQLREGIIRDLVWLLNTNNLQEVQDIGKYNQISNSVINFGTSSLTGFTKSNLNVNRVEATIRQAIIDFEPRINAETIKVHVIVDNEKMNTNCVQFEIEGELWAHPIPLQLYMKTEIDLESGDISITDGSG
jgi:type VI secretion system protein ImpF